MQMTRMAVICIAVISVMALGVGVRADFQDDRSGVYTSVPVNASEVKSAAAFAAETHNIGLVLNARPGVGPAEPVLLKLVKILQARLVQQQYGFYHQMTLFMSDEHEYDAVVGVREPQSGAPQDGWVPYKLDRFIRVDTVTDDKTDSVLILGSSGEAGSGSCYKTADAKNETVLTVAQYAVRIHNEYTGKRLRIEKILSASRCTLSGTVYNLAFELSDGRVHHAVAYFPGSVRGVSGLLSFDHRAPGGSSVRHADPDSGYEPVDEKDKEAQGAAQEAIKSYSGETGMEVTLQKIRSAAALQNAKGTYYQLNVVVSYDLVFDIVVFVPLSGTGSSVLRSFAFEGIA